MLSMHFNQLEQSYLNGDYLKILDLVQIDIITHKNLFLTEIEQSINLSYYSRSLIRLGRINEAEQLLKYLDNKNLRLNSSLADVVNESSYINVLITVGKSQDLITRYEKYTFLGDLVLNLTTENNELANFWLAYFYYLLGIAYYYQLQYDKSIQHFLKSVEFNNTNYLIKGKTYYYLAFIELELNNDFYFDIYITKSMQIYHSINAKQGMAWVYLWKGNLEIQKGNYEGATTLLNRASELFNIVGSHVELDLIESLFGLIAFHKGDLEQATLLLNRSFSSSIKLGNPMISSYILLPFIHVNIDSGNRQIIDEKLKEFKQYNKDSRVNFHLELGKAIYLKSSTRFIDKAEAQKLLINLLEKSKNESNYLFVTGDKSIQFYLTINLAEIYYQEFVISHDLSILAEIQLLLDNFNRIKKREVPKETIDIAILRSKIFIVEGEISKALDELNIAKEIAILNDYIKLTDRINKEIEDIYQQIEKWGKDMNLVNRIKIVDMELYIREAQKVAKINIKSI